MYGKIEEARNPSLSTVAIQSTFPPTSPAPSTTTSTSTTASTLVPTRYTASYIYIIQGMLIWNVWFNDIFSKKLNQLQQYSCWLTGVFPILSFLAKICITLTSESSLNSTHIFSEMLLKQQSRMLLSMRGIYVCWHSYSPLVVAVCSEKKFKINLESGMERKI